MDVRVRVGSRASARSFQTHADLRTRVPSAEKVVDMAKAFDAAEGRDKLETEYRALAEIFVNLNDAVSWQNSAEQSDCLRFR